MDLQSNLINCLLCQVLVFLDILTCWGYFKNNLPRRGNRNFYEEKPPSIISKPYDQPILPTS